MAAMPQFRDRESNKQQNKKTRRIREIVRADRFCWCFALLCFALLCFALLCFALLRSELKAIILLVEGTSTGDGRLMRAGAVPGMKFVTSFRGGLETRPACQIQYEKDWQVCQELAGRVADGSLFPSALP